MRHYLIMERILINDDILKYAQKYEQAFRRYNLDVPNRLRNIKSQLDDHNDKNELSLSELEQYKYYVEKIANDYDTKNLLVLQPQYFEEYIKDLMLNSIKNFFIMNKAVEKKLDQRRRNSGS